MGALLVTLGGGAGLGQPPRVVPLYGNATLGYYFAVAMVGEPAQPQALIIDTGSQLTTFACNEARTHVYPPFSPNASMSFKWLQENDEVNNWRCKGVDGQCSFTQSYLEGSEYVGRFALDRFALQNETLRHGVGFEHIFGCADVERGQFAAQGANGLLGLGPRLSNTALPSTLPERRHFAGALFSLCLGHNGGALRFGAPNSHRHIAKTPTALIPRSRQMWSNVYSVPLSGISVDRRALSYDFSLIFDGKFPAFFDSGATDTYFSPTLFARWTAAIDEFCAEKIDRCGGHPNYKQCYDVELGRSEEFLRSFPTITFHFGETRYDWLSQDYFIVASNAYCFGVRPLKDVILGANFMRNYDITFDQQTQTVAFTRADCSGEGGVWPRAPPRVALGAAPFAVWLPFALLLWSLCGVTL